MDGCKNDNGCIENGSHEKMKIFKIRNKNNGLFFKGGHYYAHETLYDYNWSDTGQTYHTLQRLRGTLNGIIRNHGILEHLEIVEIELVETSAKPLIDYINPQTVIDRLKK